MNWLESISRRIGQMWGQRKARADILLGYNAVFDYLNKEGFQAPRQMVCFSQPSIFLKREYDALKVLAVGEDGFRISVISLTLGLTHYQWSQTYPSSVFTPELVESVFCHELSRLVMQERQYHFVQ